MNESANHGWRTLWKDLQSTMTLSAFVLPFALLFLPGAARLRMDSREGAIYSAVLERLALRDPGEVIYFNRVNGFFTEAIPPDRIDSVKNGVKSGELPPAILSAFQRLLGGPLTWADSTVLVQSASRMGVRLRWVADTSAIRDLLRGTSFRLTRPAFSVDSSAAAILEEVGYPGMGGGEVLLLVKDGSNVWHIRKVLPVWWT